MDTVHLRPQFRISTPEWARLAVIVFAVCVSLAVLILFGWVLDLHRLGTQRWDVVAHDEDIEPDKLLQLAVLTALVQMGTAGFAWESYAHGHWWSTHWTFVMMAALAACFVALVWIRRFNEPDDPYAFATESQSKDSKMAGGNLAGLVFIIAMVIGGTWLGLSTFFCWAINYCS